MLILYPETLFIGCFVQNISLEMSC